MWSNVWVFINVCILQFKFLLKRAFALKSHNMETMIIWYYLCDSLFHVSPFVASPRGSWLGKMWRWVTELPISFFGNIGLKDTEPKVIRNHFAKFWIHISCRKQPQVTIVSRTCGNFQSSDQGAVGELIRRLHLQIPLVVLGFLVRPIHHQLHSKNLLCTGRSPDADFGSAMSKVAGGIERCLSAGEFSLQENCTKNPGYTWTKVQQIQRCHAMFQFLPIYNIHLHVYYFQLFSHISNYFHILGCQKAVNKAAMTNSQ